MTSAVKTAEILGDMLRIDPVAASMLQNTVPAAELVKLLGLEGFIAEQLAQVAQKAEAHEAKVSALLRASDNLYHAVWFHPDFMGEDVVRDMEKAREAFANEPNHATDVDGFPEILRLAAEERRRQVLQEHFSLSHDDQHVGGELALAAAAYLVPPLLRTDRPSIHFGQHSQLWPWNWSWWKPTPKDRRRELVKAVALIVAEDQRLHRAEKAA